MFLPIRSKNPPESLPIVTCSLILLNVAIYFATSDGLTISKAVLDDYGEKSSTLSPLTLLTSMFLHGSLMHLAGNMWFLYLFGFAVEGRLRSLKFSALYFGAGIAGSLLHHFMMGRFYPDVPSIGASGAIMGVVGAALYLFPYAQIQFAYFWGWYAFGLTEIPMWGVCAAYVGMDVLFAMMSSSSGGDGIGHFAHIGGALGGFLICAVFRPRRDTKMASEAKAILADIRDLGLLTRLELQDIYQSNPRDDVVLMHWLTKCMEDKRLTPECTTAFLAALPRIIAEQPILPVASCVSMLATVSDAIQPRILIEVATRVDQSGDPSTALRLYDMALRDSRIGAEDDACALFRSALIYETKVGNSIAAHNWYEELAKRYPMSGWADQAKVRLASIHVGS